MANPLAVTCRFSLSAGSIELADTATLKALIADSWSCASVVVTVGEDPAWAFAVSANDELIGAIKSAFAVRAVSDRATRNAAACTHAARPIFRRALAIRLLLSTGEFRADEVNGRMLIVPAVCALAKPKCTEVAFDQRTARPILRAQRPEPRRFRSMSSSAPPAPHGGCRRTRRRPGSTSRSSRYVWFTWPVYDQRDQTY